MDAVFGMVLGCLCVVISGAVTIRFARSSKQADIFFNGTLLGTTLFCLGIIYVVFH